MVTRFGGFGDDRKKAANTKAWPVRYRNMLIWCSAFAGPCGPRRSDLAATCKWRKHVGRFEREPEFRTTEEQFAVSAPRSRASDLRGGHRLCLPVAIAAGDLAHRGWAGRQRGSKADPEFGSDIHHRGQPGAADGDLDRGPCRKSRPALGG